MPDQRITLSGHTEGQCVCAPKATSDRVLAVLIPSDQYSGVEVMTFDGEVFAEAQSYGPDAWLKVTPIVLGKLNNALARLTPPQATEEAKG